MQAKILNKIYERVQSGEKSALVVLTKSKGSVPGQDGSVMAIFQDGTSLGTIGGGTIEYDVTKRTLEAIEKGEDFYFDYNLSKNGELKMACGGNCTGFVKIFYPDCNLVIFGAGHVSQKLARIATKTGFNVYVTDDREQFKDNKDFEGIRSYLLGKPLEIIDKIPFDSENTYIVVCTRGHKDDEEVIKLVLNREYKYIGMIGSRRKVSSLKEKLTEYGFSKDKIENIHMPIGLAIDDGSVEEIAVSILSEILMIKNNTLGKSNKYL